MTWTRRMPGTTGKAMSEQRSFSEPSAPASSRFADTRKPTNSWTARCVELSSVASRTPYSMRREAWRSSSTPCSMVLGIRDVGGDAKTHNNAVEQTAGSHALAAAAHCERYAH